MPAIGVVGNNMPYVSPTSSRAEFLRSEKAAELRKVLMEMTKNPGYNTRVISVLDTDTSYFIEKHINYMANHLKMDHFQYVQNLKLMTKIRT
jgi:hypothetical protein